LTTQWGTSETLPADGRGVAEGGGTPDRIFDKARVRRLVSVIVSTSEVANPRIDPMHRKRVELVSRPS
jgi:hypothetical protein